MNEPTHGHDATAGGDWSRVYTGLDWVGRWMADRGYTDAEIAYVVGRPPAPAVAAQVATVPVETAEPSWTIRLHVTAPEAVVEDAPVADSRPESVEAVPA